MHNIIPRPTWEIEPPELHMRFEGWVHLYLIDAKTQRVKQELHFKNILTNLLYDVLGAATRSIDDSFNYLEMGTGSTAPAATQTTLVSAVTPRTNFNGGTIDVEGYTPPGSVDFHYVRRTRLFLEAEANGNLTELGFFHLITGGTMVNRQLTKDGGGSPVTVVKTSADQLRVVYELRCYPPMGDVTGNVTLNAISYPYTIRTFKASTTAAWGNGGGLLKNFGTGWETAVQSGIAIENNTIQARTAAANPAGANDFASTVTPAAYSGGTYLRDVVYKWESGVANFATGIGTILLQPVSLSGTAYLFQLVFGTMVPKTNLQRLTLNLRYSWAAVVP